MIAVYVDAGNNNAGNPRRGWWIVDDRADSIAFIEEGYGGDAELERVLGHDIPRSGRLDIKPSQYRQLVRMFAPGADHCRLQSDRDRETIERRGYPESVDYEALILAEDEEL